MNKNTYKEIASENNSINNMISKFKFFKRDYLFLNILMMMMMMMMMMMIYSSLLLMGWLSSCVANYRDKTNVPQNT